MTRLSETSAAIPVQQSIASLAPEAEAWLVDIWGVLHNGVAPFLAAARACEAFRSAGGTVVLLSNAPRPAADVAAQLDRIGVPRAAWDGIVSSGDATRALLAGTPHLPLFHLGPDRDLGIYDGLELQLVDETLARRVVCTGLFDDETETPDDYAPLLTRFTAQGCPMICANPDVTVERGGKLVYCAGAIAAAYEALGGAVTYAGKPYQPIYTMAIDWIARHRGQPVPPSRILAIGDGVRTDIEGAVGAGIAAVYIASAVHMPLGAALSADTLAHVFPNPAVRPIAAMAALAW